MGLAHRLDMLRAYALADRATRPRLGEFWRGVARRTSPVRAARYIRRLVEEKDYLVVTVAGAAGPLYWPRRLPLQDLHMVIAETCSADDWHYYEIPETTVRDGDTVLDCGAAEGLFSLRAATRARRTVAFEPSPVFGDSLRRTFNGVPGVTVEPCALGGEEGEAQLALGSLTSRLASAGPGVTVRVTTIDRWASRAEGSVDYIKGDLEGFEMEVLRGARETIGRYRPRIAMTCYHPGNDWREMLAFCRALVPEYRHCVKGISILDGRCARPVMLHLWTDRPR